MSASYRDRGLTLEGVIKQHRAEVLYEDTFNCHRITVRRRYIFDDALAVIRSGFDEKKHVRVTFLGEPAVDATFPLNLATIFASCSLLSDCQDLTSRGNHMYEQQAISITS